MWLFVSCTSHILIIIIFIQFYILYNYSYLIHIRIFHFSPLINPPPKFAGDQGPGFVKNQYMCVATENQNMTWGFTSAN